MKAVLVTRRALAADAASRWRAQYHGGGTVVRDRKIVDASSVTASLDALGHAPDPDDVDAAIGNDSWTRVPACDGCGATNLVAVALVGEEPDYESASAYLCEPCLRAALALVE